MPSQSGAPPVSIACRKSSITARWPAGSEMSGLEALIARVSAVAGGGSAGGFRRRTDATRSPYTAAHAARAAPGGGEDAESAIGPQKLPVAAAREADPASVGRD